MGSGLLPTSRVPMGYGPSRQFLPSVRSGGACGQVTRDTKLKYVDTYPRPLKEKYVRNASVRAVRQQHALAQQREECGSDIGGATEEAREVKQTG